MAKQLEKIYSKIKNKNTKYCVHHKTLFINTNMKCFLFMGKIRCKANHLLFHLQVYDQCVMLDYKVAQNKLFI